MDNQLAPPTPQFISHDGYIFTFQQNIQPAGTLANPVAQTTYIAGFNDIADSLKTTLEF